MKLELVVGWKLEARSTESTEHSRQQTARESSNDATTESSSAAVDRDGVANSVGHS